LLKSTSAEAHCRFDSCEVVSSPAFLGLTHELSRYMLLLHRQLRTPAHTLKTHLNQTPMRLRPRLLPPLHRNLTRLIHPRDTRPYTVTKQGVFSVLHNLMRILTKTQLQAPLTPNLHFIHISKSRINILNLALKRLRNGNFFRHYFSANLLFFFRRSSANGFKFYSGWLFCFRCVFCFRRRFYGADIGLVACSFGFWGV